RKTRLRDLLAPTKELVVEIDLDRTNGGTRAAQRRRERQRRVALEIEAGREHRANRTGYRRAVTMSSRSAIHGARVHTRTAANAFQRGPELLARQLSAAAVVDEDDMQRLSLARPMHVRGVDGERLPRGTPREQAEKHRQVLSARNHLFNAHRRNV